ncbi:unnamed protein product [Protopolystoma xenopodis]|uniref:Uncharacterized protein n=1 Tax=Protopolystoma xenopodis TaxID=117903 RepID=A0A3S5ANE0_9PLAT|nr:unnamed protein product [Protopolystoma xenopodis]
MYPIVPITCGRPVGGFSRHGNICCWPAARIPQDKVERSSSKECHMTLHPNRRFPHSVMFYAVAAHVAPSDRARQDQPHAKNVTQHIYHVVCVIFSFAPTHAVSNRLLMPRRQEVQQS